MSRRGRSGSPFSLFSFQDIITCVSGIIILITLVLALELSQRKQGKPGINTASLAADLGSAIIDAQEELARLEATLERDATSQEQAAAQSPASLQRDLFDTGEQIRALESEVVELKKREDAARKRDEKLQAKRFDRKDDREKLAHHEAQVTELEAKMRQIRQDNRIYYNARTADGKKVWLVQVEGDRLLVAAAGSADRPLAYPKRFRLFQTTDFEKWLSARSSAADFFFVLVRPDGVAHFQEVRKALVDRKFSLGFDVLSRLRTAVDPETGAAGP